MSFINLLLRELAQARRWGRNQEQNNDGVDPNERFFQQNDTRIKSILTKKVNLETRRINDDAALKNLYRLVKENQNVKGLSFKGWYSWGARPSLETNELFNQLMYSLVNNEIERLEMHNLKLLNDENYVVISESLKVLSNLTILDLRQFSPIHLQFSGICSTNLKEIRLNRCKLSDKSCVGLSKAISNNPNLKKINLANNLIGDKGSELLLNAIAEGNLKVLETLNLKGNVIETCTTIVSFVTNSKVKILKNFFLDRNNIGEYAILMIPKLHNFRVRNLSLRDVKLGYLSTQKLIQYFKSNSTSKFLKKLDISNNGFSNKQVNLILKSLVNNTNIEELKMIYINYTSEVDRYLANLIKLNKFIKSIEIGPTEGGNMWSTPHVTVAYKSLIPDALRVNISLHTLRLTGLVLNSMNLLSFCKDPIYTDIFRVIDLKSCLYYGDYDLIKFNLLSRKNKNKSKRLFGEILLPDLHPQIMWRRRREEREILNQQNALNNVNVEPLNLIAIQPIFFNNEGNNMQIIPLQHVELNNMNLINVPTNNAPLTLINNTAPQFTVTDVNLNINDQGGSSAEEDDFEDEDD